MQKTAPENTWYSKNDSFSKIDKIGHHAKANRHFGSKIKILKNMRKKTPEPH